MDTKRSALWLLVPGGATAALGCLALLGWILERPLLASFGADLIPMSPSTAVLLVMYGLAVCWRVWTPASVRSVWIGRVAGWLGILIALLLLVLSGFNIHLEIEHPGLHADRMVQGALTGHMSPLTAFCFLLVGVAFLASLSRSATCPPWRTGVTLGATSVLLVICYVFLLAYYFGEPLLYSGRFIPPALNTILALALLGLTLLALADHPARWFNDSSAGVHRTALVFGLIFVTLAVGIVTGGYIHYRHFEKQFRAEVERQLSVIAELKIGELTQYRDERLSDASIFFKNPAFSSMVRSCFAQATDTGASHPAILDWLGKFQIHNQYDHVRLLDAQGVAHLSVPGGLGPPDADTVRAASEVLKSGRMEFQDFYRDATDHRVYLQILVPILDAGDAARPLGVLVLRIDPETRLYPLIKHWPTPSPSAETLLVRREGNEVVFLNELRFQKNTSLNLRVPLERTTMPAVQAALGREEVMDGIDYRGVAVVAALRRIPDSPWMLVARMNTEEVYSPIQARLWQMVILITALLFGAGASVGLVWRRQRARFYEDQAEAAEVLRLSEVKFRNLFNNAEVGMFRSRLDGSEMLDMNEKFLIMFGRVREEALGMPTHVFWADLQEREKMLEILKEQGHVNDLECRLIRKDGQIINCITSFKLYPEQGILEGSIIDITGRKRADEALRQSLHEKEMLLKEIHHRVKNNLQIISSLLRLQSGQVDHSATKAVLQDMQNRVRSMALIHEHLYRSENLASVDLSNFIKSLCQQLFRTLASTPGAVQLHLDLAPVSLEIDQAIPCGLLVNELVSNALEHAFPAGRQGELRVELHTVASGQGCRLRVADNGAGLPPDFTLDHLTSLGLKLARDLARQLGGQLEIGPGPGAVFEVEFKLNKG